MRTLALLLLSTLSYAAELGTASSTLPDGLRIAVVMENTIKADKAQVGEKVRMRVLEAVLAGGMVVIPQKAKLTGTVWQALPRSKEQPESRLGIVITSAEWKGNSVPLNAFVVAQGSMRTTAIAPARQYAPCDEPLVTTAPPSASGPMAEAQRTRNQQLVSAVRRWCDPDRRPTEQRTTLPGPPVLENVKIEGIGQPLRATLLVSDKQHVVLRNGTMLILRHAAAGTAADLAKPQTLK